MFDNPNEELKKLEQQLLAVEKKDEDFESFYNDILKEFGPATASAPARKSSSQQKPAQKPAAPKTGTAGKSKKKGKKKSKKSLKGLVITLCLECAGILAIVLWWILRIL